MHYLLVVGRSIQLSTTTQSHKLIWPLLIIECHYQLQAKNELVALTVTYNKKYNSYIISWFITSIYRNFVQGKGGQGRVMYDEYMPSMPPSWRFFILYCCVNLSGDRSAEELMTPIADQRSEFSFDYTVFCPNLISNAGKDLLMTKLNYLSRIVMRL